MVVDDGTVTAAVDVTIIELEVKAKVAEPPYVEEDRGTVVGMTVAGVGRATEPGLPVAMEAGMVTKVPCAEVEARATEAGMSVAVVGRVTEPGLAIVLKAGGVTPSMEVKARATAAGVTVAVVGSVTEAMSAIVVENSAVAVEADVEISLVRMTAGGVAKVDTGVTVV